MNQPDEFDGIFDDLTPEAFALATSAVLIESHTEQTFAEFVRRHLAAIRVAFLVSDGQINPTVWLTQLDRPDAQEYVFVPDDDETTGQWLKRLQREAASLGSDTLFYATLTVGRVDYVEPDAAQGHDMTVPPEQLEGGAPVLSWYAQHGEHRRAGIQTAVENRLGDHVEASSDPRATLFEHILEHLLHDPKDA